MLYSVGSTVPDDITVSGDVSMSELESGYTMSKESGKQQRVGRDTAKKLKKRNQKG